MGVGKLRVQAHTGDDALPVANANVTIKDKNGQVLYTLQTDSTGNTPYVELPAPDRANTLTPNLPGPHYSAYDIEIASTGRYITDVIEGVQIYDGVSSTEKINLMPAPNNRALYYEEYPIPAPAIETDKQSGDQDNEVGTIINGNGMPATGTNGGFITPSPFILEEVTIPEYITVHLGIPSNTSARNVKVKFADYIKNVASSEIYPTWPNASLRANIHAIVSLTLNRIYTEWYRGKGYDFDITNNTGYDQFFVENRNIFDNVSDIVDEIFNQYIKREGLKEPYYAEYCNGTTSTCPGLSQWGTVTLANQGLSPLQILKYYYPDDIQLVTTNNIVNNPVSYPGYVLKPGMNNNSIRQMQNFLNRIRANYPAIPAIQNPNGYWGPDTTAAVKTFQSVFGLTPDGLVGQKTWYKISSIYTAVTKLAELTSEGERVDIGSTPPTSTIQLGNKGSDVVQLQFLLNYISTFYPSVPSVIQDGTFGATTKDSVKAFQANFGLPADGVVGPTTWSRLYQVYRQIKMDVNVPETTTPTPPSTAYPGTSLKVGSRGNNILLMQQYLNAISNTYPSIPKLTEDGIFGNGTQQAVMEFQRLFGLTPDGIIGPLTWNKIVEAYNNNSTPTVPTPPKPSYPGYVIGVGSRGDTVLLVQQYLNSIANKYPSIPKIVADGIFGPASQNAVKAFQRQFGLTADGVIGPATWNKIMSLV